MNKSDIQAVIDLMLQNGTVNDEFPELGNAKITDMRPGGADTDPSAVVELVEMGWPIIVMKVDGQESFAMPKSFRERVDIDAQTIMTVN